MTYRFLPLSSLRVNRANDRHGELENETAAIAWLFNHRESHMKSLARDMAQTGEIYEPPLVFPMEHEYVVFDGNRRVTCLKLISEPRRAPTVELQTFFRQQGEAWKGAFPDKLQCQIETDRDRIDDILFRRHTGVQSGVGQSTWDDRMKGNFVERTGKGGALNVADEIEKRLSAAGKLPSRRKIPRSTLNRLLSGEAFRNRVGVTVVRGKFELTHQEPIVLAALERIAGDLAHQNITLGDLWDIDGKRAYLDSLELEGLLPSAANALSKPQTAAKKAGPSKVKAATPLRRSTLIPQIEYGIAWAGRIARHKSIWEELQFRLNLSTHPNAISVLFRVLVEISIENYISKTGLRSINPGDKLAQRALKVGAALHAARRIDDKYLGYIRKLPQQDNLFSLDTLNRYVHSTSFAPSPDHLTALWDSIADFIVLCLNA